MKTRLKTVKQTRTKAALSLTSKATATQQAPDDTCYICNKASATQGSICNGCNKNLKTICTNKNSPTDRALADAIQITRTVKRKTRVTQVSTRLCTGC